MARKIRTKERKPYIVVFWEGESEEQYFRFLKDHFHQKVNLTIHNKKGTFDTAKKSFSEKGIYYENLDYIDQIWLVFDTEDDMKGNWNFYWGIVKKLGKICKYARVRLFMTKGCIEYFFLLHFEKTAPTIATVADKEKLLKRLASEKYCPDYKKGDKESIWNIAARYETGIRNGAWSLKGMVGMPPDLTEEERMKYLFMTDETFTNTHEAVQYLVDLK